MVRLFGYQRPEAPALAALERVHELSRDYVNFLHPVRKLTEKVRRGARITRRYDGALTPYRRLLASGVLARKIERRLTLRWAAVNPAQTRANPPSVPSPSVPSSPSLLTRSGRKSYEATSASLVGSPIDASRGAGRPRAGRGLA